jgi:ATP-dependent DNA helicase DinG
MSSILDSFPDKFNPSKSQVNLLNSIDEAFKSGVKFVVCSAPTGSGKSFISKTLGNYANEPSEKFVDLVTSYKVFKRNQTGGYVHEDVIDEEKPFGAFALTLTKALQDQYKDLFEDSGVLKGKINYQCTYDTDFTVEHAPCVHLKEIKDSCWKQNSCPYYAARNNVIVNNFSVLNYNMFLAMPSHVKRREYIVCDEASEIEDMLVKEFTCDIVFDVLKKSKVDVPAVPLTVAYDKMSNWVGVLANRVKAQLEEIEEKLTKRDLKKSQVQSAIRVEYDVLTRVYNKLKTLIDTWYDSEYVIDRYDKGIKFIPLKVDKLAGKIFDYADKVVLMSATIIDPASFCKALGITEYKYVEADSTFDSKKAPIYATTKVKLNYNNLQTNLPGIIKQIQAICDAHPDDKGIIHTQTNAITMELKRRLKNKRLLFREVGVRNEEILDIHYNTDEPTILVSPSMSHGVDLKGDLAKFQIVIKAPYLPIADKRIEKLMKGDFQWYQNKMLSSFIQACGRGVRSKDDSCVTYVMDYAIVESIIRSKDKIPKYFLDRFQ